MRILQINNFEDIGGGSDRVYQLTTQLLLDKGHDVATLACGERPFDDRKYTSLLTRYDFLDRDLRAVVRNARNFFYRPEAGRVLEALVTSFRPDVVHLHIFYGQLSSSILRSLRVLGIPTVMTVHEYRMLCPVSTLFTQRLGVCERCAGGHYQFAVRNRCNRDSVAASALSALECKVRDLSFNYVEHIDHFFMVSRFCLDKHVQYLPAIAAKSSVLYNFVDTSYGGGTPSVQRDFLYCGRLSKEKGLVLLCDAFTRQTSSVLKIAGDGPIAAELRNRFGACPNICFLGKLEAIQLQACIRDAWFTIVPSEWYENNPMAILESFAQGTPVLGARIGGIPELVLAGQTGLLFEPSDAQSLDRMLDEAAAMDSVTRQRMAGKALELVRDRHSADHHYKQLLSGYEAAI